MLLNTGIACLAAAMPATAVLGAVAIRTGWMVPWLRRSTPRPGLWGYASLAGSAGLGLWSFGMTTSDRADLFAPAGLILLITNMVLSFLATRPGRVTAP